ncbi:hypothetical protein [Cellulomonas sp. P5_C5]
MRDRLVLVGAAVAVALVAFVAITPWLTPWPFDGETQDLVQRAGFAAVPAVAAVVVLRRSTAARLAAWFAVPGLLLGWGVWSLPGGAFAYTLTVETVTGSSIAVASSADLMAPPTDALEAAVAAAFLVLLTLLWTLAVVGLVTVARRPGSSSVRELAVVAALLTIPLWVPPGPRWSAAGAPIASVPATVALDATRLTALVLVLVVGGLVLASRHPLPARAAAYLVPALLLSWVWWRTSAGGSYGVAGSSTWLEPSLADRLPWLVTSVAETALVVVLWVLTLRGWHELLRRYRPPDAGLVSPTAR